MRTSAQDTYAFVQLTNGRLREVADTLQTLPIVESVEVLKGPYQLAVRFAGGDSSALREIEGVARVITLAPAARTRRVGARSPERRRGVSLRIPQPCGTPA